MSGSENAYFLTGLSKTSWIMNLRTMLTGLILLGQTLIMCSANAVCLDPKTFVSGYRIPLASEVGSADAIAVSRVLSEQALSEDPADPEGVTAYDVTVKVITRLKGNVPDVLILRNENTSARYLMSVGEEHIVFVSRDKRHAWVDSCGNSSLMPAGRQMVARIQAHMSNSKSHASGSSPPP